MVKILRVQIETHIDEAFRKSEEYFYSRMYSYALHCINLALVYDSYNTTFLRARALIYDKLNDLEEAVKDALQAIQIKGTCVWAYDFLGYAYTRLKKYRIATSYYKRAIQFQPYNKRYATRLALVENECLEYITVKPIRECKRRYATRIFRSSKRKRLSEYMHVPQKYPHLDRCTRHYRH